MWLRKIKLWRFLIESNEFLLHLPYTQLSICLYLLPRKYENYSFLFLTDSKKFFVFDKTKYGVITDWFSKGNEVNLSDILSTVKYNKVLDSVDGLRDLVKDFITLESDEHLYSMMDFALEALHQNSMLSKEDKDDSSKYSDMVGSMISSFGRLKDQDYEDFDI